MKKKHQSVMQTISGISNGWSNRRRSNIPRMRSRRVSDYSGYPQFYRSYTYSPQNGCWQYKLLIY